MSKHMSGRRSIGFRHGHRRSLLRNLTKDIIKHEKVETTLTRAKAVRSFVETHITKARNSGGSLAVRRYLMGTFQDESIVKKLLGDISNRFKTRPGGYTRIIRSRIRHGDNAPMAVISLV